MTDVMTARKCDGRCAAKVPFQNTRRTLPDTIAKRMALLFPMQQLPWWCGLMASGGITWGDGERAEVGS